MGKFKNHVIQSKTVSMSASAQAQDEVTIPVYGDIRGFLIVMTQSTTGTLTGANTIEKAIRDLSVIDASGDQLLQGIRGQDLLFLERYLNKGNNRTIPTTSSTSATETFWLPLNVEKKDQHAKIQLTVAPYSDMATSGATGGSITYKLVAMYDDPSPETQTEKIQRITKSVSSGVNTLGVNLPYSALINSLLFTVGTEANITDIKFSGDGSKELDGVTVEQLTALDDALLNDGHVSTQFSLYNSPFVSSPATVLDFNMSSSDTLQLFVLSARASRQ